jgi:hypothetical protein
MNNILFRTILISCVFIFKGIDCYAQEDNNFKRIQLNNNCSIEVPVSWKIVTSGNQDLNELSQSVRENIAGLFKTSLIPI